MSEDYISGYLYNELFSKSNKEKCMVFQSMVCSLIVDKNQIKNCSTALQALCFQSLCNETLLKGTSAILQPSVQHLVYVHLTFFCFQKFFH